MSGDLNGTTTAANVRRRARERLRPGVKTTEFWSMVGALGTALIAGLSTDDRTIHLASLGAITCLGCVLGGAYIWSRTRIKSKDPL